MKITNVEAIELPLPESEIEHKATAAQDALIIKIHAGNHNCKLYTPIQ